MDCKDNLVKFFHFKRKAQENQKKFKSSQLRIKKAQHLPDFNDKSTSKISNDSPATKIIQENSLLELKLENQNFEEATTIKDEVEEKSDIIYEQYQFPHITPQQYQINHIPLETESHLYRITPSYNQNPETSESYDDDNDSDYHDTNRGGKLSKAAIKMRKYREKLKLPENREKLLKHLKAQREWNRRAYERKQGVATRKRRRGNLD